MLGTAVNVGAIIIGTLAGMLLKKSMPERIAKAMTTAVALVVLYIGVDGMLAGENTLVLVISIIVGTLIGTLLDLDRHLRNLGEKIEKKFKAKNSEGTVAEGFVSSTLLFCVGAMTIVGALQSGLTGNHETQYTKAVLDMISSVVLASSLGWGVMLGGVSVFVIQGSIVLLSQFVSPYLNDYTVAEMTCVGSVLIVGLALNLLSVTKIKLMNFIPSIFVPILLCMFM